GSGSCSTLGTIVSQKARTAARWLSSSWKVIARLSSRSVQRIIAATRPSYKAGLEILYGGRMTGGPRGLILGGDWASPARAGARTRTRKDRRPCSQPQRP